MTVTNRELHGVDAPLDEEIVLHAGPFDAIFEPARAYLRRVRINGVESVRNVYLHARGPDWETVLPTISNLETKIGSDHFELTWHAVHRRSGIDFEWNGTLTGSPSGIYYRCDGVAVHEFKTNRTGLCVLIPREFRGENANIEHPDGMTSLVTLPTLIAPVEPLREMHTVAVGPVKLTFEGDKFEAEDQRNWTDSSFKAYQLRGRRQPAYTLMEGEKVMHAVRIEAIEPPFEAPPNSHVTAPIRIGSDGIRPLLGATLANDRDDLAGLHVDFLRVELPSSVEAASHVLDHARSSGLPLQIVVPARGEHPELHKNESLIAVGATGRPDGPSEVWLGGGSFDGFNASRPVRLLSGADEARPFDGLEVSATPQIHTFDERSILENASTLEDVLNSLRAIAPYAKLGLNVHLKGDGPDPRLESLFGALWMLRCYAATSRFGEAHLTMGATSELRHPVIAEFLTYLRARPYRSLAAPSSAELVMVEHELEGEHSYLVGNLLRTPRFLSVGGGGVDVMRLTPAGWKFGGDTVDVLLAPYEIVMLAAKSERKIS